MISIPMWVTYFWFDCQTATSTIQDDILLEKIRSWDFVLVEKKEFNKIVECTRKYKLIESVLSNK